MRAHFLRYFWVLTLLFLAPLFADLPSAALGAIVITAVVFGLFKVAEMRRLARLSRTEFWLTMAALLGVLTLFADVSLLE